MTSSTEANCKLTQLQDEVSQPPLLTKLKLEKEILPPPLRKKNDLEEKRIYPPHLTKVEFEDNISDPLPRPPAPTESDDESLELTSLKMVEWDDEKLQPPPLKSTSKPCFPFNRGPMRHLQYGGISVASMSSFRCSSRSIIWEKNED